MIRVITLISTIGLSSIAFAQGSSSSLNLGEKPVESSAKDKFSCANRKYATTTEDVSDLFKEVLGIQDIRGGRYFLENNGYSGNRVILKIRPGRTFQLQLIRDNGGNLPATMCWRQGRGGRMELIASLDASQLGYDHYTVTITNPSATRNQVNMVGSGNLSRLINFDYTLTNAVK